MFYFFPLILEWNIFLTMFRENHPLTPWVSSMSVLGTGSCVSPAPFPLWPQKRQAAALWAPPVLTERSSYILLRSLASTHAYSTQALSPLWRSGRKERRRDIRGGWSWPGLCYQSLRCLQWPSSKRCALTEPSDLTWGWQHQAVSLPQTLPWLSPG